VRRMVLLVALTLLVSGCGRLGLGEAECAPPERGVSSRTILTVQAVPSARYTPCLVGVRLGWDEVQWFAEAGEAGFVIWDNTSPFLTVTVVEECDVSDARPVFSDMPDIERYEDVTVRKPEIVLHIVPTHPRALLRARELLADHMETTVDGRPVVVVVNDDFSDSMMDRVEEAVEDADYVWIVDELDVAEGTVELRAADDDLVGRGMTPDTALDLIDDHLPDVSYEGWWYATFDGGCITYEFHAEGVLAETVAEDAALAFGFYPAYELVESARQAGFDLGG
jgi:hypothetical protein